MCGRARASLSHNAVLGAAVAPTTTTTTTTAAPTAAPVAPSPAWHDKDLYKPRHNAAPGCYLPVFFDDAAAGGARTVRSMRWGLVNKEHAAGHYKLFNARAEKVAAGALLKRQAATRRGVVLLQGFYEWEDGPAGPGGKTERMPVYLHDASGAPLRVAALFDCWDRGGEEGEMWTVTLLTAATPAAHPMAALHERTLFLLDGAQAAAWVAGTAAGEGGGEDPLALLRRPPPAPAGFSERRIHPRMNVPPHKPGGYHGADIAEAWAPPPVAKITSWFTKKAAPKKEEPLPLLLLPEEALEEAAPEAGVGAGAALREGEPGGALEDVMRGGDCDAAGAACGAAVLMGKRELGEKPSAFGAFEPSKGDRGAEMQTDGVPCSDGGGTAAPPPPKRAKLAPAEAAAAESEQPWTCQECTFVNAPATALQCEVCHSLRR